MKSLLTTIIAGLPLLVHAGTNTENMNDAYNKLHQSASIDCEYLDGSDAGMVQTIEQKFVLAQSLSAKYLVSDISLEIKVSSGGDKGVVDYKVDGVSFNTSISKWNGIQVELFNLSQEQVEVSKKAKLEKLRCSIEIAMEDKFLVTQKNLHINMHPHPGYDSNGKTTKTVVDLLNQETGYQHLLLFDDQVRKAQSTNFNEFITEGNLNLTTFGYFAPTFVVPSYVSLLVSPAGWSRYVLTQDDHVVTFTGGNHNLCIGNSTRFLIRAFFNKPSSKSLTFNYMLDGIVTQTGSKWFDRYNLTSELVIDKEVWKKSHLLKDLFKNMSKRQKSKYTKGYLNYLEKNIISKFKYLYGKVILKSTGVNPETREITGKGSGEFEINVNYL
jgi:hypothetical protein